MTPLTIDKSNFLKGASVSEYSGDGGFSPTSYGIEIDRTLGLLSPGRSLTDVSTGLDGTVVTKTKFKKSGGSTKYYLVCSNGKTYETAYNTPTSNHTLKATASTVTFDNKSHAIAYKDGFYATSQNNIAYDDFSFSSFNETWWTVTKSKTALTSGVSHKMFEFGGTLFILNGNKIASWDGTTAKDDAFTLPTGYIFTDAEVDNDIVFLTVSKANDSGSYIENKIIVWNGIHPTQWLREVYVFTPEITAIKKADQGFIFWAGNDIYFFDGYNYQWLRSSSNPNFNQVVAYEGKIYFKDTYGISCYNTRFKIFSTPIYINPEITVNALDIIYVDYIDIFTTEPKMYRASSNNQTNISFVSNWYDMPATYIRKIMIAFEQPLTTNNTFSLFIYNETNSSQKEVVISYANDGAKSVVYKNIDVRLNLAKFVLTSGNANNPKVRSIQIYYDPSENYAGK